MKLKRKPDRAEVRVAPRRRVPSAPSAGLLRIQIASIDAPPLLLRDRPLRFELQSSGGQLVAPLGSQSPSTI